MTQMQRLTKLPVDLVDARGLEPIIEDRVPLPTSSRDTETALPDNGKVGRSHKPTAIRLGKESELVLLGGAGSNILGTS